MKTANLLLLLAASCSYSMEHPLRDQVRSLETTSEAQQAQLQLLQQRQDAIEQRLNTLMRK
jgi:cell division protein FtsB